MALRGAVKAIAEGKKKPIGRPKGALNKRTLEVAEKLAELGCDPIEGMARIAINKRNDIKLRAQMFSELAQYVAPKRKSVDHSVSAGTIEDILRTLGG